MYKSQDRTEYVVAKASVISSVSCFNLGVEALFGVSRLNIGPLWQRWPTNWGYGGRLIRFCVAPGQGVAAGTFV